MKYVAIIPARGGSVRLPRKNVKLFYGKPIIVYSIETARATGLFDAIYVSTDDKETMDIAQESGCYVHLRSTAYLCGPDAGTQEVARDVLLNIEQYDYACVIYPTAPLMQAADIVTGYNLVTKPDVQYAFAMGEHPPRDAGQFYWGKLGAFIGDKPMPLIGPWTRVVRIDEKRICDINAPDDFERAERMYAELHRLAA